MEMPIIPWSVQHLFILLGTVWSALQCPHASLAQPVPSFPTATAFLSVACEPLVDFEINVVGHDQHFHKKKNRMHEVSSVRGHCGTRTSVGKELFVHRHLKPHCAAFCNGLVGWQEVAASLVDTDLFEVSRNKLSLCAQLILKM